MTRSSLHERLRWWFTNCLRPTDSTGEQLSADGRRITHYSSIQTLEELPPLMLPTLRTDEEENTSGVAVTIFQIILEDSRRIQPSADSSISFNFAPSSKFLRVHGSRANALYPELQALQDDSPLQCKLVPLEVCLTNNDKVIGSLKDSYLSALSDCICQSEALQNTLRAVVWMLFSGCCTALTHHIDQPNSLFRHHDLVISPCRCKVSDGIVLGLRISHSSAEGESLNTALRQTVMLEQLPLIVTLVKSEDDLVLWQNPMSIEYFGDWTNQEKDRGNNQANHHSDGLLESLFSLQPEMVLTVRAEVQESGWWRGTLKVKTSMSALSEVSAPSSAGVREPNTAEVSHHQDEAEPEGMDIPARTRPSPGREFYSAQNTIRNRSNQNSVKITSSKLLSLLIPSSPREPTHLSESQVSRSMSLLKMQADMGPRSDVQRKGTHSLFGLDLSSGLPTPMPGTSAPGRNSQSHSRGDNLERRKKVQSLISRNLQSGAVLSSNQGQVGIEMSTCESSHSSMESTDIFDLDTFSVIPARRQARSNSGQRDDSEASSRRLSNLSPKEASAKSYPTERTSGGTAFSTNMMATSSMALSGISETAKSTFESYQLERSGSRKQVLQKDGSSKNLAYDKGSVVLEGRETSSPKSARPNGPLHIIISSADNLCLQPDMDVGVGRNEVDGVWHDVCVIALEDPLTGEPALLIVQVDVSSLAEMEEKLAHLSSAQLLMLENIYPRHVIEFMSAASTGGPAALGGLASSHECVTLMFADIVGFTDMSDKVEPATVMNFLNDLYTDFDKLVDVHGVYKVETVGDCYIVAGGLMKTDKMGFRVVDTSSRNREGDAARVLAFAEDMLHVASSKTMPHDGSSLKMRVGIHSGPLASGIVGDKMPRFCLFGDTMNTASRMETTCPHGAIQISAVSYVLLGSKAQSFEPTGGVVVKGKGKMDTYIWWPTIRAQPPAAEPTSPDANNATPSPSADTPTSSIPLVNTRMHSFSTRTPSFDTAFRNGSHVRTPTATREASDAAAIGTAEREFHSASSNFRRTSLWTSRSRTIFKSFKERQTDNVPPLATSRNRRHSSYPLSTTVSVPPAQAANFTFVTSPTETRPTSTRRRTTSALHLNGFKLPKTAEEDLSAPPSAQASQVNMNIDQLVNIMSMFIGHGTAAAEGGSLRNRPSLLLLRGQEGSKHRGKEC